MNGYNFPESTRRALNLARTSATELGHEHIGTEHVLLGIIMEGEGPAIEMLRQLDVDLRDITKMIKDNVGKGAANQPLFESLPFTSRAKKILELAMSEARDNGDRYVGNGHLLMGILREQKGIAAQVLNAAGVTIEDARARLRPVVTRELAGEWANGRAQAGTQQHQTPEESSPKEISHIVLQIHYADETFELKEFSNALSAIAFIAQKH